MRISLLVAVASLAGACGAGGSDAREPDDDVSAAGSEDALPASLSARSEETPPDSLSARSEEAPPDSLSAGPEDAPSDSRSEDAPRASRSARSGDALHVVMSAASPLGLCVQREPTHAVCFDRREAGLRRSELATHGWIVRIDPFIAYADGARLVEAIPREPGDPYAVALPFAPVDVEALTLGVTCARDANGRVACDSFEGHADYRPLMLGGAPVVAASIASTDSTLLALDAAGRLICTGRGCDRLAVQRRAAGDPRAGVDYGAHDPGLASGTPWPVGRELGRGTIVDEGVARVRTDGLSRICIEDRAHHVACHGSSWDPVTEADATGARDFATGGNDICFLTGPVEAARLECSYIPRSGAATTVLAVAVPGARRLHAEGTTLCVEIAGGLSCTELRGISPAEPLRELLAR